MGKISRKKRKRIKKTSTSSGATPNLRLPPDAAKFQADKALLVSQDTLVKTGVATCFDLLAKRLEEAVRWDPMIVKAKPISDKRRCPGAVSQLTLNLVGRKLESPAVITLCKADRALAWVLADHPKVKEYWSLEPNAGGTVVHVTLGYEIRGWIVNRLLQKLLWRGKLEQEVRRTLDQLKRAAEAAD
jgi:uncharacterized membrane protein